jgi:acetyltransferase-like isoleucine patch superfamily enzyme
VTIGELLFCLSGCALNHDDVIEDHVALATGVTLAGEVHVETGCYLGQSCTIRQQLRIGHDSLIGMGAVVIADVPPESVMVGNPARRLRSVREPA